MLQLAPALRDQLAALVTAGYPHETCGLLLGRSEGRAVRVERLHAARNLNAQRAHDRYELDPHDFLRADEAARAAALDIVGVWHSHPDHPARPSETDRAAAWEGWSYLIASVTGDGLQDLRSWRLSGERFLEEPVQP
jgi:proteasome lid subunit RPN8/RPN11